ncbi:uncharacterized protein LOC108815722 [Raphanus sativus]|uniref:Uncharacterized protein LOC108815722 n=1 Tax=Raphanus sativus TaxID=3726 RepID=A0A6J0K6Y2_RAPSA|nr:uncharacterized protein LOC108815722 [Raphanus sativus]
MSLAMDKALMALTLDEEDVPFEMPDLPEFSSAEENKLSLMGRLLNPNRQKMPNLIMKMPRKWQKEGRVIVLEKWVENPPEDYLQYLPMWVQIRDIPVNFYTSEALTALGDLVGKTVLVAFDPLKPITQDFVRVLVKFNVANPLRSTKVVTSKGKSSVVRYNYEKIQKRCFECQRLNHKKDFCPLVVRQRQEATRVRKKKIYAEMEKKKPVLAEDDVLFGVLEEDQVNMDASTGKWKIAKEVLEEMRRYLLADTGENREIKIDKKADSVTSVRSNPQKLIAASFQAHASLSRRSAPPLLTLWRGEDGSETEGSLCSNYSTVFKASKASNFAPCSSGIVKSRAAVRRRPLRSVRQKMLKEAVVPDKCMLEDRREGKQEMSSSKKRKCSEKEEVVKTTNKAVCLKVNPNEGLPKAQ